MKSFDLTQYRVVAAEDIEAAARAGATELLVREGAILIFPADPASGLVAAAGLSYTATDARLVSWPNIL